MAVVGRACEALAGLWAKQGLHSPCKSAINSVVDDEVFRLVTKISLSETDMTYYSE